MTELDGKICEICHGEGWVCEEHAEMAWNGGDGCCGGLGCHASAINRIRLGII